MTGDGKTSMHFDSSGNILDIAIPQETWARRNPYGLVAGALGVGFVLGGGLFTPFTASIISAALRMGVIAALPVLQGELVGAITGLNTGVRLENNKREIL